MKTALGLLAASALLAASVAHAQGGGARSVALKNADARTVWVTVYGTDLRDPRMPKILKAFCLKANEETVVEGNYLGMPVKIRGEVTRNPSCQAPVACDTSVVADGPKYHFVTTPQTCYWSPPR